MCVVYDLNIPCNTHTAVDDKAVIHILKSLTLCKTVDKELSVYGNICEFTTTEGEINIVFSADLGI